MTASRLEDRSPALRAQEKNRCSVCGGYWLLRPCQHTPEEYADAAVSSALKAIVGKLTKPRGLSAAEEPNSSEGVK